MGIGRQTCGPFLRMVIYLVILLALCAGAGLGYVGRLVLARRASDGAEQKAQTIIADAKRQERDLLDGVKNQEQTLLLEAKEKAMAIVDQGRKELEEKERGLRAEQERVAVREQLVDKGLLDVEEKRTKIEETRAQLEAGKQEIETARAAAEERLAAIAGMKKEEALTALTQQIKEEKEDELLSLTRKLDERNEEEIEMRSRKILSLAIQRYAGSHVVDATTTMVELPSEDMKGRIIGKEGRNIKALEHHTGCELIVDDTPGMITISGFSPVRRQVAKRALDSLIKDGRIQPARIEEAVKIAKDELSKDMRKAGEDALVELGIPVSSIDPKLVAILGRLKYRTSYGQNVLQHSLEVARIAATIGEELGMDPFVLKKGGLFHDIGKAVDHDTQGAHPQIGFAIMKKFGFPEELCYQSIAHHEDRPRTIEGVIVKAADAISGARPGARRNSVEEYLQRLQNLENVATSFAGVEKAYAIQAGREVRIFVEPKEINDLQSYDLARDVAKKIEAELAYPGEIRVTVIRETRVVEYAR